MDERETDLKIVRILVALLRHGAVDNVIRAAVLKAQRLSARITGLEHNATSKCLRGHVGVGVAVLEAESLRFEFKFARDFVGTARGEGSSVTMACEQCNALDDKNEGGQRAAAKSFYLNARKTRETVLRSEVGSAACMQRTMMR
jgi:hypothetical protein